MIKSECLMMSDELKKNSAIIIHNSTFAAGAKSAKLDNVIRKNLEGLRHGE